MTKNKLVWIALWTTILLWGAAFPAIKLALDDYSPLICAQLRFVIASVLLLAVVIFYANIRLPRLADCPKFLALGILGVFAYQVFLNYGILQTNAGTASFMINLTPLITLFISYIWFKEPLTPVKLVGAAIAISGVWLIIKSHGGILAVNDGLVLLLFATMAWSLFFAIQKVLLPHYSSMEITCYGVWLATVGLLLISNPLTTLHQIAHAKIAANLALIFLGVFSTCIAYWTWAYTLKNMPLSIAAAYTYSSPFIAAILSYTLLGEHYSLEFLLGGGLIIAGMLIANNLRFQPRSTTEVTF